MPQEDLAGGGAVSTGHPERPPLQEAAGGCRFENLLWTGDDEPGCPSEGPRASVPGGWFLLRSCQKSLPGCMQIKLAQARTDVRLGEGTTPKL